MADTSAGYSLLMRAAYERIWVYGTSLFGRGSGGQLTYCGSGTFVRAGSRRCLLTAAHVWEPWHQFAEVAWGIGDRHPTAAVPSDTLNCLHSSKREEEQWGPDVALIEIPAAYAGRLEAAGKAFYNLTSRRAEVLASAVEYNSGLWLLVGAPGEWVNIQGRQPDGGTPADVELAVIGSTVRASPTHDGLDYIDVSLHNKQDPGFPERYGGLSGAGLWRVGGNQGEKLVWDGESVSLEGVAFYYDPGVTPEDEMIRCHGRLSIYEHLFTVSGASG